MSGKTVTGLAIVLALALIGCSDSSSSRGEQEGTPRTAPSASRLTATPTASSSADVGAVCQTVDTAAWNQAVAATLAVGANKKNYSALRADVAETYRDLADQLSAIAPQAPQKLRSALTRWVSASTAVARFIARQQPRPGIVIDYGPPEKQWEAAQKAAEKKCGRRLPDLDH
ncbi:hypothetical protein [Actinomadura opuntiae]|uniref:hypothetical protein n=1 Tax=Actinomadura sp. OS1-43 TaxID=604315 RepID=UPI00255AD615|nr:hypothetical protein [Actinomadura sp. OS1-43]MDL4818662.1 hypothetical protein [Actinomadura sp. OS1-43]